MEGLRIDRLPEGGFLVSEVKVPGNPGVVTRCLLACSRIDEALAFIRDKLDPVPSAADKQAAKEAAKAWVRDEFSKHPGRPDLAVSPVPEGVSPEPEGGFVVSGWMPAVSQVDRCKTCGCTERCAMCLKLNVPL